jgi:1-acyl-sn-glycerol-3-phosphate acyltransferase
MRAGPANGAAGHVITGPSRSDKFIWWLCRAIMLGFCKAFFRLRIEGREHLPAGPYVLAPVHRSYLDSLVCAVISGRRTRFLGKEEMWKYAPVARLWDALGGIKIARGTTDRESMRLCLDALAAGEPLAVFPEGQRRLGPVIEEMFEGAAYIASRTGVPIVPVGIGGSERAMRPGKDKVPIEVPGGGDERVPRSAVRETTKRLRIELQALFDEAQRVAGTPNVRPVEVSRTARSARAAGPADAASDEAGGADTWSAGS